MMFTPTGSTRRDPVLIALWVALILVALIWTAPFVFIVFTSMKTPAAIMQGSAFAPPTAPAVENYAGAWAKGDFSTTAFNGAVISAIKVPLGLFLSAMAAYALARIELPGRKWAYVAVVFGTMIPFQVMLAPIFRQVNAFGLINTYPGIILPYLAFGVPYQVFILHGFFSAVPKELSEAARIDGAGHPADLAAGALGLVHPRFRRHLERIRNGAGDPAGQGHVDPAPGDDELPKPVPVELRPAECRDRHDRPAGGDRLPDVPTLLRLGPDLGRRQGMTP